MAETTEDLAPGTYPQLSARRIERPNQMWAFPILGFAVKIIILLPVIIWLYLLMLAWGVVILINSFIVLFTSRYWDAAYDLSLGLLRLSTKLVLFLMGLTDRYPGFGFEIPSDEPFGLDIARPEAPSRWFAAPLLGGFVRIVLLIPFSIWVSIMGSAAYLAMLVASFPVLFTGRYPESLFELVRDGARLSLSTYCYYTGLSDAYPSFSISMNHPAVKWLFIILGVVLDFTNFLGKQGSYGGES